MLFFWYFFPRAPYETDTFWRVLEVFDQVFLMKYWSWGQELNCSNYNLLQELSIPVAAAYSFALWVPHYVMEDMMDIEKIVDTVADQHNWWL